MRLLSRAVFKAATYRAGKPDILKKKGAHSLRTLLEALPMPGKRMRKRRPKWGATSDIASSSEKTGSFPRETSVENHVKKITLVKIL